MASKSRGPLEASVESYLVKRVKEAGGKIRKLEANVNAHWPDRLVLMPWHSPALVELKRPAGGVLSDGQKELHKQLRAIGHSVWVLWSKQDVDRFLAWWRLDSMTQSWARAMKPTGDPRFD